MTGCAEKVSYASEHLACNAAVLHTFAHPDCTDIEAYRCPSCSTSTDTTDHVGAVWHIGHAHIEAGQRCKSEPPVRLFIPRQAPKGQPTKSPASKTTTRRQRAAHRNGVPHQ